MIPVLTVRSWYPYLNKRKFSLDRMQFDVYICYKPHVLSLKPFKFFSTASLFSPAAKLFFDCFIKWYKKEQSIKLWLIRINHMSCLNNFEFTSFTWKSSYKMFTFCNVLHETKQTNVNNNLEREQHGLEMIFKAEIQSCPKLGSQVVNLRLTVIWYISFLKTQFCKRK